MSRNRNKKRLYRMNLSKSDDGSASIATLEVEDAPEDEAEDVAGFEKSLAKGLDAAPVSGQIQELMFIPITKIDELKRQVWGTAYQEVPDHAGEICDFESAETEFKKWSNDQYQLSGGKSKGNIRAMHQPVGAGIMIDYAFDRAQKATEIGTEIVDENEWQKCLKGVYTGFSIGGRYKNRWPDPQNRNLIRYTPEFSEISIVDRPAIPTATFKVIKADGSEELRKFASVDDLTKITTPAPTKQTIVDTPVMIAPALNTPLTVTQADQQDPLLNSDKFIEAQNPNMQDIAAPRTDAIVPDVQATSDGPAVADMTDSAAKSAVVDSGENKIDKAVQDIPNLRHVAPVDSSAGVFDDRNCGSCLYHRAMESWGDPVYCRKYDSKVQPDWVCDAWEKYTGDTDASFIPLAPVSSTSSSGDVVAAPDVAPQPVMEIGKAAPVEPDEDEKKLIALGQRVGIARRDGSPKTPPKGYPTDQNQYGDPANYAFPVDKGRAITAIAYYNAGGDKLKAYNPRERAVLGRRIARLAEAALGVKYKFDPKAKQIEHAEKEPKKMDKNMSAMLTQARDLYATGTPEALEQAAAIMDVAIDTVSTPSAANPQPTAVPSSVPSAAKTDAPVDTKTPEPSVPTAPSTPSTPSTAQKGDAMPDNVYTTNPPAQNFNIGGGDSFIKAKMPEFIDIMARGDDMNRLNKSLERVCDKSPEAFTDLWNASCYELAAKAGFSSEGMRKGLLPRMDAITFGGGITGRGKEVELAKAFNATTAPGVYLRRLLALMLPVMNPWRQRVYTQMPTTGSDKAIWRAVLGFQSTVLSAGMRQAEAGTTIGSTTGNGVPVDETPTTFTASFQSIKTNGVVTQKSLFTMRGYDDPVTVQLLESLTAVLRIEEYQNILGNYAAVAKPTTVTVTPSTASGAVPAANYIVRVTSLTGQGWRLTQEIPSYIGGGTYTVNGASYATVGESDPTSATVQTLGGTGKLVVTWTSVPGAMAYNVYVRDDTNGTEHYYSTVTAPKVTITAYPSTGNAGVSITDSTANTLGFEGVYEWSALSTVYSQTIPQKSSVVVDAAGAGLTLVTPNSISQLDSVIQQQYTKWHIAPTLLLSSPGTTNHITSIVGSATNPPQLIVIQQGPAQGQVIGGLAATGYINRFSPWLQGAPSVIPILAHPYMPDGRISVLCENIPYPNAREGRGWTLETLRPYTYYPLANTTDQIPFMLAADELLECNHPSAQGVVHDIDIS